MTKASDNPFPSLLITEGTEPSAPAAGKQRVYIDSTTHDLKATNSAGAERSIEGGNQLDYVEFTTSVNVTATVEASATTIVTATAITFDGTTPIMIQYYCPDSQMANTAADNWMQAILFDGSSAIGVMTFIMNEVSGHVARSPQNAFRRLTPTNASHTYSIRGIVNTGTGVMTVGAGGAGTRMPGFIRITRAS